MLFAVKVWDILREDVTFGFKYIVRYGGRNTWACLFNIEIRPGCRFLVPFQTLPVPTLPFYTLRRLLYLILDGGLSCLHRHAGWSYPSSSVNNNGPGFSRRFSPTVSGRQ